MTYSDVQPALGEISKLFSFDFVSFATVLNPNYHPLLTWVCAVGNRNSNFRRIVLEPGRGIAGGVYKSGRCMVLQDVEQQLSGTERADYPITISERLCSLIALPLWRGTRVQGILLCAFRAPNRIEQGLFSRLYQHISPIFLDFEVKNEPYQQALIQTPTVAETMPVYELMHYHILQAQEEERRRISREMHDGVMQQLVGIQMLLRSAAHHHDEQVLQGIIEQAAQYLSQTQDELRGLSYALRPVLLDDLGLVAALRSYFQRVECSFGIQICFSENLGAARLRSEVETVFYRICQEALQNACKYAAAEQVSVTLHRENGTLCLLVKDTGRGFSLEQALGKGLGLRGMQERADFIDATLEICTSVGQGTAVFLTATLFGEDGEK